MTLPEITEAICRAVARNDIKAARSCAAMAAAKMGEPRASRITRALGELDSTPITISGRPMKFWATVKEPRAPWVPAEISDAIGRWVEQVTFADALIEAGERVLPLLLVGETRCGKTSSLCAVAAKLDLLVHRMSLADVVGSHMGESARCMRDALAEMKGHERGIWLVDELDAIAFRRGTDAQAATQEKAHAVGALLTEIETLPPSLPFVATSNTSSNIDPAVLGRFEVVEFPKWNDLGGEERLQFATSHGLADVSGADSYADVVKAARRQRVDEILVKAKSGQQLEIGGAA